MKAYPLNGTGLSDAEKVIYEEIVNFLQKAESHERTANHYRYVVSKLQEKCNHNIVSTLPNIKELLAQHSRWKEFHKEHPKDYWFIGEGLIRVWDFGSAYCKVCTKNDFGWYCPDSPKHFCEYVVKEDYCDWCGIFEERK